ncbi:unnamed protein product [Dovyalis caffra]|uniref:CSC1-like protein HYP1 n=1 Tax=Dovyalis caffra TaxID=77055 RepID=A0AAV1QQB5_9ROSI|nr:unnamed protein product [Dovyalis caffra]
MILSALLTSVGINLGLCLLFFTLYSILRKQPGNVYVYAPRLVDKEKSEEQDSDDFDLERLLPTAGWVRNAWQLSEDEILSISGLDGLVFIRIFTFSLKVFTVAGVIGILILLPVNYFGNQLNDDFDNLPNKSLDSFSISNVNDGSNRERMLLSEENEGIVNGGLDILKWKEENIIANPNQFTILVRSIPSSSGRSFSETVESFFTEYHPSTYLSHSVVCRTRKIRDLIVSILGEVQTTSLISVHCDHIHFRTISDVEKLCRKLGRLKLNTHSEQNFKRDGFLGLFGRKVNLLDHYEKKLEDMEENLRMERNLLAGEEVPAAFVSFKSRFGAAVALHIQQGVNPTEWVTERAPDPQDVHWPFFSASFIKRWIFKLVVFAASLALIVLFLIPVVIVQGLANLDQLEIWFPFLKGILSL